MNPLVNILDHVNKVTHLAEYNDLIEHWDDESSIGNGIIITLKDGYEFEEDPGCGVRGFDTSKEAVESLKNARKK